MKSKVEMMVRKDHKFRGTWRKKGEALSVTNKEANVLAALGWAVAKPAKPADTKPVHIKPAEVKEPKKREYKRADVVPPEKAVMTSERFAWPTSRDDE